ncbi:MAG: hypothetical protein WA899_01835, partial [Candidatus Sulfotelmatobacter sp.]
PTEAAPALPVLQSWAPQISPPGSDLFHKQHVTSNLARSIQISDHGRGRDGRVNPHRRAPKSFASRILVSKFFDIRILPGISC